MGNTLVVIAIYINDWRNCFFIHRHYGHKYVHICICLSVCMCKFPTASLHRISNLDCTQSLIVCLCVHIVCYWWLLAMARLFLWLADHSSACHPLPAPLHQAINCVTAAHTRHSWRLRIATANNAISANNKTNCNNIQQ